MKDNSSYFPQKNACQASKGLHILLPKEAFGEGGKRARSDVFPRKEQTAVFDSIEPSIKSGKPFQPAIGSDFDVVEAKTRGFLARLIGLSTVTAVGVTGLYGLLTNDYMTVMGVWSVTGPIIGAVLAYYFGLRRKDTG